jgi:hypothetical protein
LQVFKITSDFDYLSFYTHDPDRPESPGMREMLKQDILLGSGTPRAANWKALPLYAEKEAKPRGNFAHLWGLGKLGIDSRASELLKPILRDTCELLPFLPFADGEVFHRFNLLARVDCLNKDKTRWFADKSTGANTSEIEEYHFHPSRLEKSSLFLLPKGGTLFAVTGTPTPEFEFKTVVEREGLTGLKFELLWSEGGPPIRRKSFFW